MKYRVVFRERSDQAGEQADEPSNYLEAQLDDDVVLDSVFVGRLTPDAQHSSDTLEEDDDFLNVVGEIWEYDVADGRDEDFKAALLNSGMVMEFDALEAT